MSQLILNLLLLPFYIGWVIPNLLMIAIPFLSIGAGGAAAMAHPKAEPPQIPPSEQPEIANVEDIVFPNRIAA
jgi:hypothetical protein